jgi:DNA-directed RNA polymerase subunit M/transcription elongation factor TFIIS
MSIVANHKSKIINHKYYGLWTIAYALMLSFIISGCKVYSFTGASVSPDLKTLSIESFLNKSQNANTAISQDLTDKLKNRLVQETPLRLIPANGDLEIKGYISNYITNSQAPVGGNNTLGALQRLTITVKVECSNKKNEKDSWEQSFTRFADFPSTTPITQVERELWDVINRQIVDDIFNRAFVNW